MGIRGPRSAFLLLVAALQPAAAPLYGYVACVDAAKAKRCELVVDPGTLSAKRYALLLSNGKGPYPASAYEGDFVRVIGVHDGRDLRVLGISLSVPGGL